MKNWKTIPPDDWPSWISSLIQKNLRLKSQNPRSFSGLPKAIEVLGLESDICFSRTWLPRLMGSVGIVGNLALWVPRDSVWQGSSLPWRAGASALILPCRGGCEIGLQALPPCTHERVTKALCKLQSLEQKWAMGWEWCLVHPRFLGKGSCTLAQHQPSRCVCEPPLSSGALQGDKAHEKANFVHPLPGVCHYGQYS